MKDFFYKPGRVGFLKALILAGAALVLAACMMDAPKGNTEGGGELRLSVSTGGYAAIEPAARMADSGYSTTFANGDKIGVTVVKNGTALYDNYPYKYTGGTWGPSTDGDGRGKVFIPPDLTGVSWLVYYPFSTGMDGKLSANDIVSAFSDPLGQDQSDHDTQYTAVDLMISETTPASLPGRTLGVTLTHKLAMVEFVLPAGSSSATFKAGSTDIKPWNITGTTTYHWLAKAASVTLSGTYTRNGVNNIAWSKSGVNLTAGRYTKVNVTDDFYIGDIEVAYDAANPPYQTDQVTYNPSTGQIPWGSGSGTVRSVKLLNVSPNQTYLVGRDVTSGDLKMKFDADGNLQFRAADTGGYIPIGSYAEFQLIRTKNTESSNKSFKQEAHLDLMEEVWEPVSNNGNFFKGVFDGGGKTLSRLKITKSGTSHIGLFKGNTGTIRNVHIADSGTLLAGTITGGENTGGICGVNQGTITDCSNEAGITGTNSTGGVVGSNENGGTITTCSNTGNVNGGFAVGGVAGQNAGAITGCSNGATITGTSESIGGVVGNNENGGTITGCYNNNGAVNANSYRVGGVAGRNEGAITACYNNNGTVGGTSTYSGGVVGGNYGAITACYNTGTVSGYIYVGGVAGGNNNGGTITACYNTGGVSGSNNVGGVAGGNAGTITITACYWLFITGTNNANYGIGYSSSDTNAQKFSNTVWPGVGGDNYNHAAWDCSGSATGPSPGNGLYWRSLGTPSNSPGVNDFPKLWFEP